MTKAEHARAYILKALKKGPKTAKQLADGAGISIKYMRGILCQALKDGAISANRKGPMHVYYIGDTAPKRTAPQKKKATHSIPTKSVVIYAETRMGFVNTTVTMPAAPWECRA